MAGIIILLSTSLNSVTGCPSSCIVCSEDETVCQGLAHITAVPKKTKSLIITDGNISLISISNFSNLADLTQLTLINSNIARIHKEAFNNLAKLKTLILDNNDISVASITEKTLFPLQNLEILKLNNNVLSNIYGSWFKSTNKLLRLELNGNHITKLTNNSFGTKSLGCLRHLDLSINFISVIEEYAFQALHQLRELDLSKNRLTTVPDTFSLLSHLILLNLSHNQWNCTCELEQLSDFLQNYTSSATRILENENNLHCSYSSNPAVHTVLQLTERNCLSAPHNITLILKDKGKTFSLRDFVLIAVLCLAGAISLFCLITVLLMHKLQRVSDETSRNCCSGIIKEFQCGPCPTNPHSKQYDKFQLKQESGTNVMSIMDYPGVEKTVIEHGRANAQLEWHPSNMSFKMKSKEMLESVKGSYFICLDCRLIQQCPSNAPGSLGNVFETNEVEGLTNIAKGIETNPRDFRSAAHWEGVHGTILQKLSEYNRGFVGQMCEKKSSVPKSLMPESEYSLVHAPHLNACSLLPGKEQIRITSQKETSHDTSSLVTNNSVEMKIHAGKPPLYTYQSQRGGHSFLLGERKNTSSQPNNSLICKYLDCDKLEDHRRQITDKQAQNVKFEEQKTQTDDTKENCFLNDDNMLLSARVKRMNIPRTVGFYIPNIMHDPNTALITSVPRKDQSFKICPGSKYLLRINKKDKGSEITKKTEAPWDSLKDVNRNNPEGNTKSTRKRQDCLMVKMNLQPFSKVRIHPQQIVSRNTEPTKRGCSPKHIPLQLHRKKIKGNHHFGTKKGKDSVTQALTPDSPSKSIITDRMSRSDSCSNSQEITASEKRVKRKLGKTAPLANTCASASAKQSGATTMSLEESDKAYFLQSSISQSNLESTSQITSAAQCSNVFSKQADLKSEVDHTGQLSTEQSQKHTEHRDLQISSIIQEPTANKSLTQCERKATFNTPQENVHNRTLSNVAGDLAETEFGLCVNSISGETEQGGSLLSTHSADGYLENKTKGNTTIYDQLGTSDKSLNDRIDIPDNVHTNGVTVSNDAHFSDSPADTTVKTSYENKVLKTDTKTINDTLASEMLSSPPTQNIDRAPEDEMLPQGKTKELVLKDNEDLQDVIEALEDHNNQLDKNNIMHQQDAMALVTPPLNSVSQELSDIQSKAENKEDLMYSQVNGALNLNTTSLQPPVIAEQANLSGTQAQHSEQNSSFEKPESELSDQAKLLTTTSAQSIPVSPEIKDIPSSNPRANLPSNYNEYVLGANEPNTQVIYDKLDENNIIKQVSTTAVKELDLTSATQEKTDMMAISENKTVFAQSHDNDDLVTAPPMCAKHADASSVQEQQPGENNSNNNHAPYIPATETRKKRLSLSESSKVIIVVESGNETINVQKYLSERIRNHQIWQSAKPSNNEPDSISGDRSQRKKISLILPEKSNTKGTNKKIK